MVPQYINTVGGTLAGGNCGGYAGRIDGIVW